MEQREVIRQVDSILNNNTCPSSGNPYSLSPVILCRDCILNMLCSRPLLGVLDGSLQRYIISTAKRIKDNNYNIDLIYFEELL